MHGVTVIAHPLVQHNLAQMRDRRTQPQEFRRLLSETAALMVYEATRNFSVSKITVQTPLGQASGSKLRHEIVLVPVLRAGLGMLNGILGLIPHARVGFIGLKREETTLETLFYHRSFPVNLASCEVLLIDPMLATGGSSVAAADLLVQEGARRIRVVNLVAAPEGLRRFQKRHPSIPIYTAAVDKKLSANGFILPGLGDAGDRQFGT
jgi:uracil phosphoribosyltransferase